MKYAAECFDKERLNQWLRDDVSESDERELNDHLTNCEKCRERLDSMAAEQAFWQDSTRALAPDAYDFCDAGTSSNEEFSPVLKSLIAPSEDPHSLGRIGRFEIMGVVGSGGMGTVLKSRDVDIDRIVALKLPAAHLLDSPISLERIEREARSAATIRHPGIIEIYQVERWRGIPYLVMPFHTGPSLMARLSDGGAMGLLESIRVARQTAEALAAAHDQAIIHRDVKPGNILLGKGTDRAVLTDFGIAKVDTDAHVTATGVIVGTPAFLSPEQAIGSDAIAQSDLFSLGTVLWSMLAGQTPFVGLPTHTIVTAVANGKMPDLRRFNDGLPVWAYRLVDWLHEFDPADRPGSARQCADALRACEQHLADPIKHRLPMHLSRPKRRRLTVLAIVAASVAIAVVTIWSVWFNERPVGQAAPAQREILLNDEPHTSIASLPDAVDQIRAEMDDALFWLEQMAADKQNEPQSETTQ